MPGLSLITAAIVHRNMVSARSDGSIQFQASGGSTTLTESAAPGQRGADLLPAPRLGTSRREGRAIVDAHALDTLQLTRCATHRLPETP